MGKRLIIQGIAMVGVLFMLAIHGTASAVTFDNIEFWTGTGSNESALVIDWNDGIDPVSLIWGYRWDGSATGEDMLTAVVENDARLYSRTSEPGPYGVALFGLGYDVDNDGFIPGANESVGAGDPDDHWCDGWVSGYWSYWLGGNGTNPDWGYSGTGMSGRTLSSGSWDGWSFAMSSPDEPIAAESSSSVPIPGAVWLLGSGLLGIAGLRRSKNNNK